MKLKIEEKVIPPVSWTSQGLNPNAAAGPAA